MMAPMTHGGWADDADITAIDEHSAICLAAHETGNPLWGALVEGTTFKRLVDSVTAVYASMPDQLPADVDALFAAFRERGLLGS